jgi:hypothetical protein
MFRCTRKIAQRINLVLKHNLIISGIKFFNVYMHNWGKIDKSKKTGILNCMILTQALIIYLCLTAYFLFVDGY